MPRSSPSKTLPTKIDGIPIRCAYNDLVPTADYDKLKWPRNPNKHGDRQIAMLCKVIQFQGIRRVPRVSNLSGKITAGHGTFLAVKKLGLSRCPIDRQDYANKAQEEADVLADNRLPELAELDESVVTQILKDLQGDPAFDIEFTGFDGVDFESMIENETGKSADDLMDISPELDGAKALKDDMNFTSKQFMGIPELLPEMLGECPTPIVTWAGRDASVESPFYFYNFGSDSIRGLDLEKTVLGFYVDDYRFDKAWLSPADFFGRILNRKITIALSPNFSTFPEYADAVNMHNIYRSRWVGRYMQEAGIKVIPDFQITKLADGSLNPAMFAGIPVGLPCAAIQSHTTGETKEALRYAIEEMKACAEVLKPKTILCYAGGVTPKVIKGAAIKEIPIIVVQSRSIVRAGVMKSGKAIR